MATRLQFRLETPAKRSILSTLSISGICRIPMYSLFLILCSASYSLAQTDTLSNTWKFSGDYRFRIEQDWDSQKSDGTFRDNRTRLRYRLRAGVSYQSSWYTTGFRIRTGDPRKQQDPQLTLGDGFKEFGTLPIGFEKVFFEGKIKNYTFGLGKNDYPFNKNNELFWSDNVYPEGVYLKKKFNLNSVILNKAELNVGHFIISTSGLSLWNDAYFQGAQINASLFNEYLDLFPSLYIFRNIPNIPDGNDYFQIDYSIIHIGSVLRFSKKRALNLELDLYYNQEDYTQFVGIGSEFKDQNSAYTIALSYGKLAKKGDFKYKLSYNYQERFAAVDFLAQNDWARWDYSVVESPDGRLTNYQGMEADVSYKLNKKSKLTLKYYRVNQLIPFGTSRETGQRVRLDLDTSF